MALWPKILLGLFVFWQLPAVVAAYPLQNDFTPGQMALLYKAPGTFWGRFDAAVVDAGVTTSPPDATTYDRRLEALTIVGANYVVTPRFGVRGNFAASYSKSRVADELESDAYTDLTDVLYRPSLDFTYVTQAGLEVYGGLEKFITAPAKEKVVTTSVESETRFNASSVDAPRFGVIRRAGFWEGGLYYRLGAGEARSFRKTASDGTSLTGSEEIFVPTELGILGIFKPGIHQVDFEFRAIQAGEGGIKSEDGDSIQEDHYIARLGYQIQLAGWAVNTTLQHKTLSYAKSVYINLDTIPLSELKLRFIFNTWHVGLLYANGRDGQSLPEFNARYQLQAYGLTFGFNSGL